MDQASIDVDSPIDSKRYWWLLSPLLPLQPSVSIVLYLWLGHEWLLAIPLLLTYLALPLLDLLLGQDTANPNEAAVLQMEQDPYYQRLAVLTVIAHFITFFVLAWAVGTQAITWGWMLVLAITCGAYSGLAINTGHELGHKRSAFEQRLGLLALSIPAYGHFSIEHNRGHHRDVATPQDPVSARMGESIYSFMLREVPGAFKRGWRCETIRLQREKKSRWGLSNQILQSYCVSVLLFAGLSLAFGWIMLPFLLIQTAWAWFQLTSANYIEHYGLLREKSANGRYENCKPYHSWNANALASNLVLFQLERHSDHHANPTRGFQSLRHFNDAPQLPTGYFGMYLVAYIPRLWFAMMDKRLLATPHISGDLSKVNIAPAARDSIYARYA